MLRCSIKIIANSVTKLEATRRCSNICELYCVAGNNGARVMAILQNDLQSFRDGTLPLEELFQKVRPYYHSLSALHREDVIEFLIQLPEAEASRELLLLYRLSLWRSTRMRIVQALARTPSLRALEFLIRLACDETDLLFCEQAIWALGRSGKPFAARFLCNLLENCSAVVRPSVVMALGESLDCTMSSLFLAELSSLSSVTDSVLAKNLALTLAQLKEPKVQPVLEQIVSVSNQPHLVYGALLALGKVARSTEFLDAQEGKFQRDILLWQLSQSVRLHIQFRVQWKLEDYLQKIFESDVVHPALPLELNGFDSADVREGLRLFLDAKHLSRMLFALGGISFPDVSNWYADFFEISAMSEDDLLLLLQSISKHMSHNFEPFLRSILAKIQSNNMSPLVFDAWAQTMVLCLPKCEDILHEMLGEKKFEAFSEQHQLSLLNAAATHAIVIQKDIKRRKATLKAIESVLLKSPSHSVLARGMRVLGQIEEVGNKTHDILRAAAKDDSLIPSCLFLMEKVPSRQSVEILADILTTSLRDNASPDLRRRVALVKCAAAQSDISGLPEFAKFLEKAVLSQEISLSTEALLCVFAHPLSELVPAVKKSLAVDALCLPAVLAAKSLGTEELVDAVGGCLRSSSESVVGRALDALVTLPGARSKRLVLDFFCANPLNDVVCDKVIRCLEAPPRAGDFFAARVQDVLDAHPNHLMREGLLELKERFLSGVSLAKVTELSTVEIQEIDKEISVRFAGYSGFDADVKAALRAAEMPFHRPESFRGAVDKSSSIIAWCKAIDIALEKHLGRKILFPRIDKSLADFQNVIHCVGLSDPGVSYQRLRATLGLEESFSLDAFPGHKMVLVAQGVLSGRIVQEHWRILDGLRAWAVVILLFGRGKHMPGAKALLPMGDVSEKDLVQFAKRLITLQDMRNPAAHRETWLQFPQIDEMRNEVAAVFREWNRMKG